MNVCRHLSVPMNHSFIKPKRSDRIQWSTCRGKTHRRRHLACKRLARLTARPRGARQVDEELLACAELDSLARAPERGYEGLQLAAHCDGAIAVCPVVVMVPHGPRYSP